jgi:hypothetical protein
MDGSNHLGHHLLSDLVSSVTAIPFQPRESHVEDLQFMLNDKKP